MLQGLTVPGLKSFLELVRVREEQLSTEIGNESESKACAWSTAEADMQVITSSCRLRARARLRFLDLIFVAAGE
jgi:hypothetical protein